VSDALERLNDATTTLAEISTAKEAWELARTAEAARRFAQMKGLGTKAVNYATSIKAKAMMLLADFVDAGQLDGSVAKAGDAGRGRPIDLSGEQVYSMRKIIGTENDTQAYNAVRQARNLRDTLRQTGQDVDALIAAANSDGEDLGIKGLRMAAWSHVRPEAVAQPVAPPVGQFSCIVVDPPWPMEKIERLKHPERTVLDYPTMTLEQMADDEWVPVRQKAADDCHLYLWVTHRFLPAGLDLLERWDFRYQCVMTWRKNIGMTPFSWMYDTEHVLFGRRGNLPLQQLGLRLSFDAPTSGHSVKPEVFYERVRQASPGPRLDMFPGVKHDDFEPWGLEATHRGLQ
jgi:N6-adenosine-specific RNA methylase IME4